MDFTEHGLDVGALRLVLRTEGIEHRLVLTGHHQAALDAHLLHQARETKTVHQHTDAAHQAGLVDIDRIGRCSDVVGGRGAGLFHHGVDLLVVQRLEPGDLVIDDARLHRAAARRVDQQHQRLGAIVIKRRPHRTEHVVGTGLGAGGDLALDLDQRGVWRAHRTGPLVLLEPQPDHRPDQQQPSEPEKQLPTARGLLFAQGRKHQFFDRLALPATFPARGFGRHGGRVQFVVVHVGATQNARGANGYCACQYTTPSRSTSGTVTSPPRQGPPRQAPLAGS